MTATMLHKEYGHRSPWYSIGAYTVATVTGVTRQLNNRHWMSDVMVGAGIGILATEFGYFLADLIFKDKGLHVGETQLVYDRFRRPSFLSFTVGVTTSPGSYLPYPGDEDFVQGRAYGRGAGGMVRLALCRRGRAFCRDEPRDDRQWRAAGR